MAVASATRCPRWCYAHDTDPTTEEVWHYGGEHTIHAADGSQLAVEVSQPISGGRSKLTLIICGRQRIERHELPLPVGAWLANQVAWRIARRQR